VLPDTFPTDVDSAIRGIVRRKLRVTLSASDRRARNLDAQDLVADIQLKILRRFRDAATADPSPRDPRAYAAVVAYHACAEYLGERCPQWCRVRNFVRRLMEKRSAYAVWKRDDDDRFFCGFSGWRHRQLPAAAAPLVEALLEDPTPVSAEIGRRHFEQMRPADWERFLDALFDRLGAPVSLDDVASIAARTCGIEEPLDAEDEVGAQAVEPLDRGRTPYSEHLIRQRLALLWRAIVELLPWHRIAFLLNIPEGEIESFPHYEIVSVSEMAASLQISSAQFDILWTRLPLTPGDRDELPLLKGDDERFSMLFKYLPLDDNAIAAMLGVGRPQVIGYRRKAVERLKRHLRPLA
jgi:hypothetical protein